MLNRKAVDILSLFDLSLHFGLHLSMLLAGTRRGGVGDGNGDVTDGVVDSRFHISEASLGTEWILLFC